MFSNPRHDVVSPSSQPSPERLPHAFGFASYVAASSAPPATEVTTSTADGAGNEPSADSQSERFPVARPAISMMVIDDHQLVADCLTLALSLQSDFEVLPAQNTLDGAVDALNRRMPDIVLLDLHLDHGNGTRLLDRLPDLPARSHVIAMSGHMDEGGAVQLVARKISGLFLKTRPLVLLTECIRRVMEGEFYFDQVYLRAIVKSVREQTPLPRRALTRRDREILRLLLEGMTNKEIGKRLSMSESAVKSAFQVLFHAHGVSTRSQLVRIALERYREELLS